MKKQFTLLLNSSNAILVINKYCTLRRWTKDAIGNDVDKLEAVFSIRQISDYTAYINARDMSGILAEVAEHQTKAFTAALEEYNSEMLNGHINGRLTTEDNNA